MVLFLGVGALQAQQNELTSEVLAISVGTLKKGPFGFNSADLPWRSNELGSGAAEWTSGTSVLLLAKLPPGSRPLSQGHQLLSFVDDSGKNLAKLPEGVATDSHGFPGRNKALTVSANEAGTEALVVIRSLKCPNKEAAKISGEVEIALTSGSPELAVSLPVPIRVGAKTTVGPVVVAITKFGRPEARGNHYPPGMPTPPTQLQNRNELGIQVGPSASDASVIKLEILNGTDKKVIQEITGINPEIKNMTHIVLVSSSVSSIILRVTYATGQSKTSGQVRFSTGLGIYEE